MVWGRFSLHGRHSAWYVDSSCTISYCTNCALVCFFYEQSSFGIAANVAIISNVYKFQQQDPSTTEESRALRRRLVLGGSVLTALVFTVVDAVFSVVFARNRQGAASGVAFVAACVLPTYLPTYLSITASSRAPPRPLSRSSVRVLCLGLRAS